VKRRCALAGVLAPWLGAEARAQRPGAMPTIGFLCGASADQWAPFVAALRDGLADEGYVEGRSVAIDYRWADGRYERLPALARALVERKVALIAATAGVAAVRAARDATRTIPIVFTLGNDPVALGIVPSLARPGGNVTGAVLFAISLMSKRLELLHTLLPQAKAFAVLVNPQAQAVDVYVRETQAAAQALGVALQVLHARSEADLHDMFSAAKSRRAAGVVVSPEPFFDTQRERIVDLARSHALPAIFGFREYAAAGGLMSYGPSLPWGYRQAGVYAGRVLNGVRVGDLPIVQPTRFELVLNLRTAAALGLAVPQTLRVRADEVIS
jgi:putative ABC transport system substrate-binding protein